MKTILMQQPGGIDVLKAADIPVPTITRPDQVLIKIESAGVNPIDTKLRANGTYFPDNLPCILGCDAAGHVIETGSSVKRFKPGDEVYYYFGGIGGEEQGNYAEYNVVPEGYVALKPEKLGFAQAAAVPLALITAWESLHDHLHMTKDETVLVQAGAGGVGHLAIQLAKIIGCRVITTVSSADKASFVTGLGADEVINYKEQDVSKCVMDLTDGRGVDAVLDCVGGKTFARSFAALKPYGRIVSLIQYPQDIDWKLARLKNIQTSMELMLSPAFLGLEEKRLKQRTILETCATYFDQGKLKVEISQELSLSEAAKAHQLIEAGGVVGKIVLNV